MFRNWPPSNYQGGRSTSSNYPSSYDYYILFVGNHTCYQETDPRRITVTRTHIYIYMCIKLLAHRLIPCRIRDKATRLCRVQRSVTRLEGGAGGEGGHDVPKCAVRMAAIMLMCGKRQLRSRVPWKVAFFPPPWTTTRLGWIPWLLFLAR